MLREAAECAKPPQDALVFLHLRTDRDLLITPQLVFRQGQRRLSKYILPSRSSTHVCVAEPKLVIERLPIARQLLPELCGDHGRVAPNSNSLGLLIVVFVSVSPPRILEHVGFGVSFSGPGHQNKIVS